MKDGVALAGSLEFMNLGDLLQMFGSNGSTGVLRVISQSVPEPGVIHIRKGNPVNAFAGEKTGLDAMFSLFGWTAGDFEFTPKDVPTEKVITKGRMEIILDGLRMLDDGEIAVIGPVAKKAESAKSGERESEAGGPLIRGPLIDYMYVVDEEEFAKGQEIVKEKSHGNWIWVLVQGMVQIQKATSKGPLDVVRVAEGCFIGSLASFTVNGNVRSATSLALENVSLGVLDTQRLFTEFSGLSPVFRKLLLSLERRLRQVTDHVVKINTGAYSLDDYIEKRKPAIRQGKPENRLFRITEGDATVVRYTDNGNIPLAKLFKGDFFGSAPFYDLGLEPGAASILASEGTKIEAIDADPLQAEYDRMSPTFRKLIEHTATCISVTTMVAQEQLKKAPRSKG
ncbi:MAG: cyclic nucleotide-binding domain-containing protein [Desulfobacterales bacterium]|jgi:CRP-like cAMP-binding protein